ncbi:MAG: hypothetical protein JWP97_2577 [Labilithrix sp.]|nr:hypothetical protein [Labilithrix sp.]
MAKLLPLLLCIGVASLAAACSASGDEDADDAASAATDAVPLSYVGKAVSAMLEDRYPAEKGATWNLARDGKLAGDFVKQFPPRETWGAASLPVAVRCDPEKDAACDPDFLLTACSSDGDCAGTGRCEALKMTIAHHGQAAKKLCIGHSEPLIDDLWQTITDAKTTLDLSSLAPPDGRFEAGIRNAITYASEAAHPPHVRIVVGDYWSSGLQLQKNVDAVLASLTRDVAARSTIDVTVAAYSYGAASWDHAKIVARDGELALVGGANLWDVHYLGKNPVHDLWIQVEGSPAADAQRFVDRIFQFVCTGAEPVRHLDVARQARRGGTGCPHSFAELQPHGGAPGLGGHSPVITVGRTGFAANPSDDAFVAMIDAARTKIHLSQQDLGPIHRGGLAFGAWPKPALEALVRAMGRGVDVDVILSNTGAVPGSLGKVEALYNTYDNGWTPAAVGQELVKIATSNPSLLPAGADAHALVCERLQLMRLRSSRAETWPDGGALANHVKAIMVDDQAFYVGSQNVYAANLTELGYIVDDAAATRTFITSYLGEAERYSRRTAISGAGVSCGF